jgi:protein subunit release factor B
MKELLFSIKKDDFIVQTFRAGGKGGQKQNKTSSGVRIIHKDSGAVGESRSERSQHQNKKLALDRLVNSAKFRVWHSRKVQEILERKTIDEKVEESMNPNNLKIEVKDEDGKWTEESDNQD